ncbi:Predicted ATP-dependent carboligase, ATP-grasp superfamily [Blastococcus sp. DSM 46786]|uniref:carboxylate--amine ligase n=1 Tax=Blastococcus sp. DSM 46786 TaxID=1798227 RepID=UPI0008C669BB|nr:carboxylate--amine ligase [Blastococcus sp. DSM 46786]SEK38591.1 Predicted ATP-dependent carboligase, ATP-grasp superfamily [Blastococcus sp. DSM 46786]
MIAGSRRTGTTVAGGPPAVVLGLDTITGLQTARILAARGVPVIGVTNSLEHYACRTRACTRVLEADLRSEDVVDVLLRLGPELGDRAALFPCTDLAVLQISRHRDRLAPWYHVALPEHAIVDMLMDKVGFLRHAQEHGLPIPGTVIIDSRDDAERAARSLTYPVALKPPLKSAVWQSHTSAKAFPVSDGRELLEVYDRVASWSDRFIAQEWVDGGVDALYSCNAYFGAGSRPLVTFVARKLRQWPPHTGTSSLGEECRNDEVLRETLRLFAGLDYRGLAYVEMKQDARTGRHLIIEPNIGRPTGRSAIAEAGGVELLYTAYCDMVGRPLPAARHQRYVGAKWIDDRRDVQSALYFVRRGQLGPGDWWRSVRGPKWHAVVSRSDPQPFVHDLLQAGRRGVGMLLARGRRTWATRRRATGRVRRPGPGPGSLPGPDGPREGARTVPVPLSPTTSTAEHAGAARPARRER